MTRHTIRSKMIRTVMALAMGGSTLQFSGCDPAVRETLLQGLQNTATTLSTALITAFFQGLDDGGSSGGLSTT